MTNFLNYKGQVPDIVGKKVLGAFGRQLTVIGQEYDDERNMTRVRLEYLEDE